MVLRFEPEAAIFWDPASDPISPYILPNSSSSTEMLHSACSAFGFLLGWKGLSEFA